MKSVFQQTLILRNALSAAGTAILLGAGAIVLAPTPAAAQERSRTATTRQFDPPALPASGNPMGAGAAAATNIIVSPDEDYRIGPSDVVDIQVGDAPELSGSYRVGASGKFQMPVVGAIDAKAKTTEELAGVITEKLKGNYLVNPQVGVIVKQINSHTFFVQGAVRRPGSYQIEGRPSLLKLITVAGGLNESYGSTAFIIREVSAPSTPAPTVNSLAQPADAAAAAAEVSTDGQPPPKLAKSSSSPESAVNEDGNATSEKGDDGPIYELTKANINRLLRGNFDQNVTVEPGSMVHIPPTDIFFVAGEVLAPGSFQLREGTTLRQAISLAQGTRFEAATGRGVIFREDPTSGKREEIKVDVGAVMSGKRDDVAIMPNDIIIVPNSRARSASATLLKAFGLAAPRAIFPRY